MLLARGAGRFLTHCVVCQFSFEGRHPDTKTCGQFCRCIDWFKPDSGLKDMMAPVTMLTDRPATARTNGHDNPGPTRPFTATRGHGTPFRIGGNNGGKGTVTEYVTNLQYMSYITSRGILQESPGPHWPRGIADALIAAGVQTQAQNSRHQCQSAWSISRGRTKLSATPRGAGDGWSQRAQRVKSEQAYAPKTDDQHAQHAA